MGNFDIQEKKNSNVSVGPIVIAVILDPVK